jgi:hypothetical protein
MHFRLVLAASLLCLGALPQQTMTIDKLVEFLHSSIQMKLVDKQVANYVAKIHLAQKLDDKVIEQLQGDGLGPKTVAALRQLSIATASLPSAEIKKPTPPPPPPPPPSYDEQNQIITEAREYSLNYTKTLPDFICLQVTRRYYDPNGADNYRNYDTVMTKVSYFEQHEKYELMTVNNKFMTASSYESLGGTLSSGEFGSMLREIFEPKTDAEFHWLRWATLRGRRAHVYTYVVDQAHSQWSIEDRTAHDRFSPGYSGLVYVDRDTHAVVRVTLKAEGIPPTFPIQEADDRLDYDLTDINGRPYMLPMMAQVHLRAGRVNQRNDIEFRNYRKFSADTNLKFEEITADPLPDEKTKEQPIKP